MLIWLGRCYKLPIPFINMHKYDIYIIAIIAKSEACINIFYSCTCNCITVYLYFALIDLCFIISDFTA